LDHKESNEWLGYVRVDPLKPVIAGEYGTWVITYVVGKYGIDNGGRIKLVWKYASNWGIPQWDNPDEANYVSIRSSGNASFSFSFDSKGHYRPWLKALTVHVYDGYLCEGEYVYIILGDKMQGNPGFFSQTFYQRDFYFRLLVDCFETGNFKEVSNQPVLSVSANKAEKLSIIAPSFVSIGEKFKLLIKAEDRWGNPAEAYSGKIYIKSNEYVNNLPMCLEFNKKDKGVKILNDITLSKCGSYTFTICDENDVLKAKSNVVLCKSNLAKRLFWCDLHGQTSSTLGEGTNEQYFKYARDVGGVDVSSIQGNDFHLTTDGWEDIKRAVSKYNQPGEFITILGYEWSGNTGAGGDHNVYYFEENSPIYRSSHWQIDDKTDVNNDRYPVNYLYDELRNKKACLIPHIGGRRAVLDYVSEKDQQLIPVIEICSVHGRFEWFLHEAFEKGLIVGVVGNSDDHTCRPGSSYPIKSSLNCRNGLTGIYAEELTRESVLDALRARECFATTGERIIVEFFANDQPMGSVLHISSNPVMNVNVVGTSPLEKVEIIRDYDVIYSESFVKEDVFKENSFRIIWGGARLKTRGRSTKWDGTLRITGGQFVNVEELFFLNPQEGVDYWNSNEISWKSCTSGDCAGLEVTYGKALKNIKCYFHSEPISFNFSPELINKKKFLKYAGGVNQHVKVEKTPKYNSATQQIHFTYQDNKIKEGLNRYYIRVVQENNEMAWSSPIYINYK